MKNLITLNPGGVSEEEIKAYPVRGAARGVVIDADGNVALLHVSNSGYYKLPGGGIEEGEDPVTALRRECKEEIGCDVEIIGELGLIEEYRKSRFKQLSYCYTAKVKGVKGTPKFEQGEIDEGFKEVWVPYEEAVRLIETSPARNAEGKLYIVPRDTLLLKEARKKLADVLTNEAMDRGA